MIYDQGFEVKIGGLVFFAFSKFTSIPAQGEQREQVKSDCSKTSIGWYSHEDGDHSFGCFQAKKIFGKEPKTTLTVTQGTEKFFKENPSVEKDKIKENDKGAKMAELVDYINKNTKWSATKYTDPLIKSARKQTRSKFTRRLQDETKEFFNQQRKKDSFGQGSPFNALSDISLPVSWDWRNVSGKSFVAPVRQQGACGSCYIFAEIAVMEARLKILMESKPALKKKLTPYLDSDGWISLSQQDVVSCSKYSQGCQGGFPYLVGKYAHDYHVVPSSCFPYTSIDGSFASCDLKCKNPPFRVRGKSYDYIGGYYGASNAQKMQIEILKNGPIAVNILTLPDFGYYEKGVYYHLPGIAQAKKWKKSWEPVTHSVVIVGWGVEKETQMKYWIVENSWGNQWGQQGFFMIRRETDEIAIESETSSVIPQVIFQ